MHVKRTHLQRKRKAALSVCKGVISTGVKADAGLPPSFGKVPGLLKILSMLAMIVHLPYPNVRRIKKYLCYSPVWGNFLGVARCGRSRTLVNMGK